MRQPIIPSEAEGSATRANRPQIRASAPNNLILRNEGSRRYTDRDTHHPRHTAFLLLFLATLLLTACSIAPANPTIPDDVRPSTIAVGITPDGDRFLLIGTREHGAFVSFNDGESWTRSEGLPGTGIVDWEEPSVMDIEIAPDGETAFAATITGLYRSTDFGRSWNPLGPQTDGTRDFIAAWDVSISPRYDETGLVAAIVNGRNFGDSVLFSGDRGKTWDTIPVTRPEDIQVLADSRIGVANARTLAVYPAISGESGALIYSSDHVGRATFSPDYANDHLVFVDGSYFGNSFCPLNTETHVCYPSSGYKLRAYTWRGNHGLHISSTTFSGIRDLDGGGNAPGIAYVHGLTGSQFLGVQPSFGPGPHSHANVVLSPDFANDGTGLAITWDGLARTTDSGQSWDIVEVPTPSDEPLQAVTFAPDFADSHEVYAVTERRLLRSTDGGATWQAFPSLDDVPPIPTSTPRPTNTPGPSPTPQPPATAAPSPTPGTTQ